MRTVSGIGRIAAVAAVVAAVVLVAFIIFGGGGGYTVKAYFQNGNQIVKGNQVELDGTPIGSVKSLDITPDGQAVVTIGVQGKYAPLPSGVHATIRQASQSGIANRYVDLTMPAANSSQSSQKIPDAGRPPRRPLGADPEPRHDDGRDRVTEGRARRRARPPARLHAPLEHHVREPALGARPGRPAGGGFEAGRQEAEPVPRSAPAVPARPQADGRRPAHDRASPRRPERPDRADEVLRP